MTTLAAPAPTGAAADLDPIHRVCPCDTDTALCGTDVTHDEWYPANSEITCPMCVTYRHCTACGTPQ